MLKKVITSTLLLSTIICISANATQYHPAKITHIAAGGAYGGDMVIRLDNHDDVDKPGCASGFWAMQFDGSTEQGKQAYVLGLLAWSTEWQSYRQCARNRCCQIGSR